MERACLKRRGSRESVAALAEGYVLQLKGTGFSPYIKAAKTAWALAPEGLPPSN
jgi:hypothetical protein